MELLGKLGNVVHLCVQEVSPSLCSAFLDHEAVRLGLGQGPCQPGGIREHHRARWGWEASKDKSRKVSELAHFCVSPLPHRPETRVMQAEVRGGEEGEDEEGPLYFLTVPCDTWLHRLTPGLRPGLTDPAGRVPGA